MKLNISLHQKHETYGSYGGQNAERVRKAMAQLGSSDVLDYGCGKKGLEKSLGISIQNYDPAVKGCEKKPKPADIVVCTDVLEHVEQECIDTVLDHLEYLTKRIGYFVIANRPAKKILEDGRNAHLIIKPADWWLEKLCKRFNVLSMTYMGTGFEVLVGRGRSSNRLGCYELLCQPTTFDFALWAILAKSLGMTKVVLGHHGRLKPKDYSEKESWERLANIIIPICEVLDLHYEVGPSEGVALMHTSSQLYNRYYEAGKLAKFVGEPKGSGYVTVTMRNSRKPTRNSNRPEWEKFIKWCPKPVELVEDYAVKPISLKDRLDLYAGADMNLMVNNGPAALCYFSDYPIISMKNGLYSDEEAGNFKIHGIDVGFQWPHFNRKQRLVWEDDSFESIKKHYEEVMQ